LGGKSNPFYIRRTNQIILHVKKFLLALFTLCLTAFHGAAQGTYVNVIINGLDPTCGIESVSGSFYSGEDSVVVTNVTFQMAGAIGVYGALLPVNGEAAMLTVCAQTSPNCGFVICVDQMINANTGNTVLINFSGGGGGGSNDADMDGYAGEADCDDNDPLVNPGMDELCNDFTDNNCNGELNEGCNGGETDNDNDGFSNMFDCNDNDASINPNAAEICGDSIDNNCNILVDEGCNGEFTDADMDGYDSTVDCNDNDYLINPGMPEFCDDNIDNNCNGAVDEEGCVGNPFDCNPDVVLLTDSTSFGDEPGVVWILNNVPIVGVYTYMWDFGDGNTSTDPFPTNVYDLAGTYTVCLTVTGNGCTGTTCITFTVTPEGDFIPGGMPMTGFTLNVVGAIPNSVKESAVAANLSVFPNPVQEQSTLTWSGMPNEQGTIEVIAMDGRTVFSTNIASISGTRTLELPTGDLASGVYLVRLSTASGLNKTVQIVK
jgi:hypothetical protein